MIKFFRKIRRNLIREGKTGAYLKYAIGEIALVVIGILIALQINNWNEAKKDRRALNEYLVKIKAHTNEDIIQLAQISEGRKGILDICRKARNSILNKTEDENLFIFMTSGLAFADYYFKPNSGGYESLKNSEYFGKINNTKLDSLLAKYHGLVDIIAENEKSYNEYIMVLEAELSVEFDRSRILASAFIPPDSLKTYATPQSEYDQDFIKYTSLPAYRNVISLAAFQFESMVNQYGELTNLGEIVIEEIDAITGSE